MVLGLDFGRRRKVAAGARLQDWRHRGLENCGSELIDSVEVLFASHEERVIVAGSDDFIELFRLIRSGVQPTSKSDRDDLVMRPVHDKQGEVERLDLVD